MSSAYIRGAARGTSESVLVTGQGSRKISSTETTRLWVDVQFSEEVTGRNTESERSSFGPAIEELTEDSGWILAITFMKLD